MNHLSFYREHGISPVRYVGTREQHFQRRASLYRSLRLPPLAFRGATVLEVAAGTGQNAEYISSLRPIFMALIEPNPQDWSRLVSWPCVPYIYEQTLQSFDKTDKWDVILCENWLGLPEVEAGLLDKLASLVAPQGVLVLTCVHPLGIYPNMLRRRIAARLVNDAMSFENKTQILVSAFETHLATIKDMTRSAKDWVQDWLLNPAVEHIGLTFPMLIERLGAQFDILGTSPEFVTDWRWFKSLHGDARRFNENALQCYHWNEEAFRSYLDNLTPPYKTLEWNIALKEADALLAQDSISIGEVRAMPYFKSLFGRETLFTSWMRREG